MRADKQKTVEIDDDFIPMSEKQKIIWEVKNKDLSDQEKGKKLTRANVKKKLKVFWKCMNQVCFYFAVEWNTILQQKQIRILIIVISLSSFIHNNFFSWHLQTVHDHHH